METMTRIVLVAALSITLAGGCASHSTEIVQPPATSHMKSAVGTSDELSPLAPPEARNVRKVGNQWQCEVKGQEMRFNPATSLWENMLK